jgi:hypothetical protein
VATATAIVTLDAFPFGVTQTQRMTVAFGTVAVSASPDTYAAGGLALSFVGEYPKTLNQVPKFVSIVSGAPAASGEVGGYIYLWNQSTNKFQIMAAYTVTSGTGPVMVEMTDTTAIPAAVSGDTIRFMAWFENAL